MSKNINHINYFILTFALVLLSYSTNAQEVRVIDNKGTIQTVKSNTVTTSNTISTPQAYITANPGYTPVENDTYIYKPTNGEKVYYIFDSTENEWNMIAPTKAARVFYPPSYLIDASVITPGGDPDLTLDLHELYRLQFTTPAVSSTAATGISIPTYAEGELYYYVTDFDNTILQINGISDAGVMSYRILDNPADDNTLINVVFVVK